MNEIKKQRMIEEQLLTEEIVSELPYYYVKINKDIKLQYAGVDLIIYKYKYRWSKITADLKFHYYDSDYVTWELKDSKYTNHTWTQDSIVDKLIWVTLYNNRIAIIDFRQLQKDWKKYLINDYVYTSDTGGKFMLLDLLKIPVEGSVYWDRRKKVTLKKNLIHS